MRPSPTTHESGLCLPGGYRLVEQIGSGAMGTVWRAHDENLGREVAIKIARHSDPALAVLIEREGRALAQVHHPAVVPVFAAGRDASKRGFLAMELLVGSTLQQHCDTYGALGASYAVSVMLHVLDGLIAAHARGLVHRDIKPSNVFLAEKAHGVQPMLIDFGIASTAESALDSPLDSGGTPQYMAPEQLQGIADKDAAIDQWASAVTLYYVASGKMPFAAGNLVQLLSRIQTAPLPFPLDDSIPPALFAILAQATRKARQDRYPSIHAFRLALTQWAETQDKGTSS